MRKVRFFVPNGNKRVWQSKVIKVTDTASICYMGGEWQEISRVFKNINTYIKERSLIEIPKSEVVLMDIK